MCVAKTNPLHILVVSKTPKIYNYIIVLPVSPNKLHTCSFYTFYGMIINEKKMVMLQIKLIEYTYTLEPVPNFFTYRIEMKILPICFGWGK
jgi:hypothetical protein